MKRRIYALLLVFGMALSLVACGRKSSGQSETSVTVEPDTTTVASAEDESVKEEAEAQEESDSETEEEEDFRIGTFLNGDEMLIVEQDGTLALINSKEQSCTEGKWSGEGESYTISAPDTTLDGVSAVFRDRNWKIGDKEFEVEYINGHYKNEKDGDGFEIGRDGSFVYYRDISNKKGKTLGTADRDGWQWLFDSPVFDTTMNGVYLKDKWIINDKDYDLLPTDPTQLSVSDFSLREIYSDGEPVRVMGMKLKELEKEDLSTKEKLDLVTVDPGALSPEIEISRGSGKAKVIAINPYEKAAPLSECMICSFYTEDTTGVFQMDSEGRCCGQENYDELLNWNTYEYTKDKLVYKEFVMPFFSMDLDFDLEEPDLGKQILQAHGDSDLTLYFNGDTLSGFRYVCNNLYYHGLNDNVEELSTLDSAHIEGTAKVRDDILTQLKSAFEQTDVEVGIDEESGEISMSNAILFEKNSSDLSGDGKKYLDQFMEVYVPVLFSDQFIDSVAGVQFEGHTDSSGEYGYNKKLSQKRAKTVLMYCLSSEENGLTKEQKDKLNEISKAKGFANSDPVYAEGGAEDADASRRVAVKFFVDIS